MAVTSGGMAAAAAAGALVSGVSNFGTSYFNSARSYKQNAALMGLQYLYQRQLNRNAYQDTTYSMRKAGINPMLAINNGASSGSVGLNSNSQADSTSIDMDLVGAISTAKQLKNDTQRVKNETDIAKSIVNKQQYEADLAHENSAFINQQNRLLNTYGDQKELLEMSNLVKQGEVLEAQKNNFNANSASALSNAQQNIRQTNSYVSSSAQSTKNQQQALRDAQRDFQFYKKHPVVYGINKAFGSASPLINSAVRLAK